MLGDAGMKLLSRKIRNSDITVHHCKTRKAGPTIAITANLHGDECNGVAVVFKLLELLKNLQRGSVVLYPSLNPLGLQKLTRSLPGWSQDINRRFPGYNKGDELDRHVALIWKDLSSYELNAVIDVHTDSGNAFPYVLIDRVLHSNDLLQRASWELADVTGLFSIWEYQTKKYKQFRLDRSLAGAVLNQMKVPSITIEVGPRRHLKPASVDVALLAIHRVLHQHKMLPTAPEPRFSFPRGIWRRVSGPRTISEGLILPVATPGKRLVAGDVIGKMISKDGLLQQEVMATETCVVLAFPDKGYLCPGQTICTLAVVE